MDRLRRRQVLFFAGVFLAVPFVAIAQQRDKVRRIGFLAVRSRSTPSNPDAYYDAFLQAMRELGYAEGHNLVIEWRFADGNYERLSGLAADLVQLKPELIMTHSTPATEALRRATSTIPIVATGVGDPVRSGLVTSLARPEGNITGLSIITTDVSAKYVELLQILIPKLSRAAFLMNPGTSLHAAILKGVQAASHQVGVEVLPVDARTPEDIERGHRRA